MVSYEKLLKDPMFSLLSNNMLFRGGELETMHFWDYLLRELVFVKGSNIHTKHAHPDQLGRVDIKISKTEPFSPESTILCIIKCRKPTATVAELDQLESEALAACVECVQNSGQDVVYALTTMGPYARLWVYYKINEPTPKLLPLVGNEATEEMPSVTQYIMIGGPGGAELVNKIKTLGGKLPTYPIE